MYYNVMDSLDVERFLDLRVRRHEQVYQNERGNEEEEGPCWEGHRIGNLRAFEALQFEEVWKMGWMRWRWSWRMMELAGDQPIT